jgi:hypothetical protein
MSRGEGDYVAPLPRLTKEGDTDLGEPVLEGVLVGDF